MIKRVLLDMDGVLVNFIAGVVEAFNRGDEYEEILENWPKGEYNIAKVMGVSSGELWERIDRTENFWRNLRQYPWAELLISEIAIKHKLELVIATSPSLDANCAKQKVQWLQDNFSYGFRDFMIGSRKELMANPETVLIDDSITNCAKFEAAGGHVVLFPQPWNGYVVEEPAKCALDILDSVVQINASK